jgi:hypothetical protein
MIVVLGVHSAFLEAALTCICIDALLTIPFQGSGYSPDAGCIFALLTLAAIDLANICCSGFAGWGEPRRNRVPRVPRSETVPSPTSFQNHGMGYNAIGARLSCPGVCCYLQS